MTVYGNIYTVVTIEYAENILKFIAKEIFYATQKGSIPNCRFPVCRIPNCRVQLTDSQIADIWKILLLQVE